VAARTARTAAATSGPSAKTVAAKAPAAAAKAAPVAEPAAAKAPVAKPAAAKVTPAPKATPKPAATPTPAAAAKPTVAAKPTAAKATAAKPTAAQPIAAPTPRAEATPAKPAVRPTPYKRTTAVAEAAAAAPVASEATATEVLATEVVAAVAEGRRGRLFRTRPPSIRRRPALYLAAALVGAIGVSGFGGVDPMAQATDTMSHSVSVAQELGIPAAPSAKITDTHATERLGVLAATRKERGAEQAAAAQNQAAANQSAVEAARPQAVLPVNGAQLTSTFGMRWGTLHAGIDLAAPMRTPEMAAMDGVVLKAGPASGFGLAVYIQHANGDVTVYGHMDQILVTEGQVVKAGDVIALLGARGQATGPHLHFEVHVGGIQGEKIDPIPWLRARGVAI
jgi:murein DD-endopeptidase MepM/ murein hydrolase activator NlpD